MASASWHLWVRTASAHRMGHQIDRAIGQRRGIGIRREAKRQNRGAAEGHRPAICMVLAQDQYVVAEAKSTPRCAGRRDAVASAKTRGTRLRYLE
jgi:hypothetical protein